MPELKTLNGYEIVDQTARDRLDNLIFNNNNNLAYVTEEVNVVSKTTDSYPHWCNYLLFSDLKPNTTYTISCAATNNVSSVTQASICIFDLNNSNNDELTSFFFDADGKRHSFTFTINDKSCYGVYLYAGPMGIKQGVNFTTTYTKIKLEYGSRATPYIPIYNMNPNLITTVYETGADTWNSWMPGTGINQCKTLGVMTVPGYFPKGATFTVSVDIVYNNMIPESGKTLKVYSQGSVDDAWSIGNSFTYNLIDESTTSKLYFSKKYIHTTKWSGNGINYEIAIRVDNSNGTGMISWKNLKIEYGGIYTPYIPHKQNQILSGADTPSSSLGESGDFYVMY